MKNGPILHATTKEKKGWGVGEGDQSCRRKRKNETKGGGNLGEKNQKENHSTSSLHYSDRQGSSGSDVRGTVT